MLQAKIGGGGMTPSKTPKKRRKFKRVVWVNITNRTWGDSREEVVSQYKGDRIRRCVLEEI